MEFIDDGATYDTLPVSRSVTSIVLKYIHHIICTNDVSKVTVHLWKKVILICSDVFLVFFYLSVTIINIIVIAGRHQEKLGAMISCAHLSSGKIYRI
jgi:hypothetical protein